MIQYVQSMDGIVLLSVFISVSANGMVWYDAGPFLQDPNDRQEHDLETIKGFPSSSFSYHTHPVLVKLIYE